MNKNCRPILECVACGGNSLEMLLNLGAQPLANSFMEHSLRYPLAVQHCSHCTHLQLSHSVDPRILFENYVYVSGTSDTMKTYSDWFANWCMTQSPTAQTVLDIACNDGTQLNSFKSLGLETFGIDPAKNLYPQSSVNHKVVADFLTRDSLLQLGRSSYDIITAQNVLAHTPNPLHFLSCCRTVMNSDSLLVIQTSQSRMVASQQFDTIYHEHISFFNPHSMRRLAERAGLKLVEYLESGVHGYSWIFLLTLPGNKRETPLERYKAGCSNVIRELRATVDNYREQGYQIVGLGAAAKGVTVVNAAELELDCVLDENPLKTGHCIPGTAIPVRNLSEVAQLPTHKPILFVALAWNFLPEMRRKIENLRAPVSDKYLHYNSVVVVTD